MKPTPPKPKRGRLVGSPKALDGSTRLGFKIDSLTLSRLDKIAETHGETRSQVIRDAINLHWMRLSNDA